MRLIASAIAEIAGLVAIVTGLALFSPVMGWMGAGIALMVIGLAIDPPARGVKSRRDDEDL